MRPRTLLWSDCTAKNESYFKKRGGRVGRDSPFALCEHVAPCEWGLGYLSDSAEGDADLRASRVGLLGMLEGISSGLAEHPSISSDTAERTGHRETNSKT
jgi:hypothetical protein